MNTEMVDELRAKNRGYSSKDSKNISASSLITDMTEGIQFIAQEWRRQKLPLALFLGLCINLLIAPVVYAAANGALTQRSAWAVGILGLVTVALTGYLFVVVFQPERF